MQCSSMCALRSQRIAADRPESISDTVRLVSEWASEQGSQAASQAGRQAGVPDGYGNHRTCFQAPETTKRAQTNLLHSQQSVRPPSIYCVHREEPPTDRRGSASAYAPISKEWAIVNCLGAERRPPSAPSTVFCTSEYRWLSTSVRREHYIKKRTPVNWIAVIVLTLYWFRCLWGSFVWCCVINLTLVLFSLNG